MTKKAEELLKILSNPDNHLYEYRSVVLKKNTITYRLRTKDSITDTTVHSATVKVLFKYKKLKKGAVSMTLGGYCNELFINS